MQEHAEVKLVERFFARMQESIERMLVAGEPTPQKGVRFSIGQTNWCLDPTDSYTVRKWTTDEPPPCEFECSLSMDLPTLCAIATGKVRPMQAFLSGKLQIQGDRQVLREYSEAIRLSIEESTPLLGVRMLDVHVVNAITERAEDNEMVVKYVLQVTDSSQDRSWMVRRRFSEFVKLRAALVTQGFRLSAVRGRSRLFYSQESLIASRMVYLDSFLAQILHKVPTSNYLLSSFLAADARPLNLHRFTSDEMEDRNYDQACEDIRAHVASAPITYDSNVRKNNFLTQEFHTLRTRLASLETPQSAFQRGGVIMMLLNIVYYLAVASAALWMLTGDRGHSATPSASSAVGSTAMSMIIVFGIFFSRSEISFFFFVLLFRGSLMLWQHALDMLRSPSDGTGTISLVGLVDFLLHPIVEAFLHAASGGAWLIYVPVIAIALAMRRQMLWRRSVAILGLGLSLLALYGVLRVVCQTLRLSDPMQQRLYAFVDTHVATFYTHQIAQFKSIFIKFAQYMGARTDIMGVEWTDRLSKLQDQCMESAWTYVRDTVERDLRSVFTIAEREEPVRLEDVFEDFQSVPVASASIAQVHFAQVDIRKLRKLAVKSNPEHWKESLRRIEELLVDSSLQPLLGPSHDAVGAKASFAPPTSPAVSFSTSSSSSFSTPVVTAATQRHLLSVAVKVQHEDIHVIMQRDMAIVAALVRLACKLDERWQSMAELVQVWNASLREELDFEIEASHLAEMRRLMSASPVEAIVPLPLPGMTARRVLVMTRVHGYKVTDRLALTMHGIERRALVIQIAHCCAYQLLQRGVFNADPHPGNLHFAMRGRAGRGDAAVVPALLDFGMTVRIAKATRLLYCELVLALFEGELATAAGKLQALGYATNQTHREPERDAQFFAYLLRDAMPGQVGRQEQQQYSALRDRQRQQDVDQAVREKGGRQITALPQDFLYITRVIGLLRGLATELQCDCPILHILALHARAGVHL